METRTAARRHESSPNAIGIAIGAAVALALTALAVPSGPRLPASPLPDEADRTAVAALAPAASDFACGGTLAPRRAVARTGEPTALPSRLALLRAALGDDDLARMGGEGVRIECRGTDASTASGAGAGGVTWRFELEQLELVRTLDGGSQLNAFESRHTVLAPRDSRLVAGSVVAETVSLPPAADWVAAPDGRSLVAASSARRGGAAARCRTSSVGRCTVALDVGWRLSPAGRGLALEQTFWVNGRAAEHVRWRLGG